MKNIFVVMIAETLLVGSLSVAYADGYTYTTLNYPYARSINDSGQIVGYDNDDRGFLILVESILRSTIQVRRIPNHWALIIEDRLSGIIMTPERPRGMASLYSNSTFTTVDYAETKNTILYGINDEGQTVGRYVDSGGLSHSFLLSGGAYTPLIYPGASWTVPYGINNKGQIVGSYTDSKDQWHGFVFDR